jgi:hypothetical protein
VLNLIADDVIITWSAACKKGCGPFDMRSGRDMRTSNQYPGYNPICHVYIIDNIEIFFKKNLF